MEMRELDREQFIETYQHYLLRHFPPVEHKPLPLLLRLREQGRYFGYAFFEQNEPLGYSFFTLPAHQQDLLLDYFAVHEQYRNAGCGSAIMKLLQRQFAQSYRSLLGEVEDPDFAEDEEDRALRWRRIGFYQRTGFTLTQLKCEVQQGRFLIISCPLQTQLDDGQIKASLLDIYTSYYGADKLAETVDFEVE